MALSRFAPEFALEVDNLVTKLVTWPDLMQRAAHTELKYDKKN